MKHHVLVLVVVCLFNCLPPSRGFCASSTEPAIGDRVEILLKSGEVIHGVLKRANPDYLLVIESGLFPKTRRIPRSEISNIGDAEEVGFTPKVIRIKVYDKLPLMGISIVGGVFAADRFRKEASERDAADALEEIGSRDEAKSLKSDANSHAIQAWAAVLVGTVAFIAAITPSYKEIPIVSARVDETGGVYIGLNLTRLLGGTTRSR